MQNSDIIKILTDQEHLVERQRNTALARGNWAKAIECDAVLEFSALVRKLVAEKEQQPALTTP